MKIRLDEFVSYLIDAIKSNKNLWNDVGVEYGDIVLDQANYLLYGDESTSGLNIRGREVSIFGYPIIFIYNINCDEEAFKNNKDKFNIYYECTSPSFRSAVMINLNYIIYNLKENIFSLIYELFDYIIQSVYDCRLVGGNRIRKALIMSIDFLDRIEKSDSLILPKEIKNEMIDSLSAYFNKTRDHMFKIYDIVTESNNINNLYYDYATCLKIVKNTEDE